MWIDQHPYISIYLLGCALVVVLIVIKIALQWFLGWITKGGVVAKNLRKLLPDKRDPFGQRAAIFVGTILFEAALSWINVAVVLWQMLVMVLKQMREVFSSVPESVKVLRFALRNNPNMTRESVWAYTYALGIRVGGQLPNLEHLLSGFDEVTENHPTFNKMVALEQLGGLNVLSPELVRAAQGRLAPDKIDDTDEFDEEFEDSEEPD